MYERYSSNDYAQENELGGPWRDGDHVDPVDRKYRDGYGPTTEYDLPPQDPQELQQ